MKVATAFVPSTMATVAFAFVAETAAAGETVAFTTAPDWAFARTVDPSVGLARASVGTTISVCENCAV